MKVVYSKFASGQPVQLAGKLQANSSQLLQLVGQLQANSSQLLQLVGQLQPNISPLMQFMGQLQARYQFTHTVSRAATGQIVQLAG